jgi:hypothetical protein
MKRATAATATRDPQQWRRLLAGVAAILFGVVLAQLSGPGFSARTAQSYSTHSLTEFQR